MLISIQLFNKLKDEKMAEDKYLPLADYSIDCSRDQHDFRMEYPVVNLSLIKEDRLHSLITFFQLGEVKCGSCHRVLRVYAFAIKGLNKLPPLYLMNWHPLTKEVLEKFNSLPEAKTCD